MFLESEIYYLGEGIALVAGACLVTEEGDYVGLAMYPIHNDKRIDGWLDYLDSNIRGPNSKKEFNEPYNYSTHVYTQGSCTPAGLDMDHQSSRGHPSEHGNGGGRSCHLIGHL